MKRAHLFWAALALLAAWQCLAWLVRLPILPAPGSVLLAFFEGMGQELGLHLLASLWRVLASMILSVLLAVPAGLALGGSPRWNAIFAPLIYLVYPVPKVVLVPVLFLFFGINDLTKVLIIFLILFFQVLVLVRDQAADLRPELLYSVRSLGAGRRALFRYVYLPATLPAVLTAIRQSIGTAVAVLYIVELVATRYGLGYYIFLQGNTLFDYPKMYAGVLAMSLLGLCLYFGADLLQRRLCAWQFTHHSGQAT